MGAKLKRSITVFEAKCGLRSVMLAHLSPATYKEVTNLIFWSHVASTAFPAIDSAQFEDDLDRYLTIL